MCPECDPAVLFPTGIIIAVCVGGFFYVLSGIVAARSAKRLAAYDGPQRAILPSGSRVPPPRVVRAYAEIVREEQRKLPAVTQSSSGTIVPALLAGRQ